MTSISEEFEFFSFSYNNVPPKTGSILLAVPSLCNSIFARSAVILVEYNASGAIGFILNKPTEFMLCDLVDNFDSVSLPIYTGGPVGTDTLHFIHDFGFEVPNTIQISEHLYWGGSFDYLRSIADTPKFNSDHIRFFIGYSGWGVSQLEEELEENDWVIFEPQLSDVFSSDAEHIWGNSLSKMGDKYSIWANYTEKPELN